MICSRCGTSLPDEARFCSNCGQPITPDAAPSQESWQTCEIVCELVDDKSLFSSFFASTQWFQGGRFKFWARASGPQGEYSAAESPVFKAEPIFPPQADDGQVRQVYHDLMDHLIDEGWELLSERGEEWYSRRFRRLAPAQ